VQPKGGATNLSVSAWYRSGTTGTFTQVTMVSTTGHTYASEPLPAGLGDGPDGVGTVQYYYSCSFTGLESELAETIVFLCGARASYITGQVIAVDGGFEATGIGLPTLRAARRNL
jgi:NAD(P)-dependent dehydrogenase (short-subunit alcohol dehydrogenase family)